jgi:hypothetical protein
MAEATFEYQLGEYAGRTYLLTARAVPGFDDPAEFAVVVHYKDPDRAETEQVARIDTATIGSASVLRAESGEPTRWRPPDERTATNRKPRAVSSERANPTQKTVGVLTRLRVRPRYLSRLRL